MVARLTPDQKAACSNHVGVSSHFLGIILAIICIDTNLKAILKGVKINKSSEEREIAVAIYLSIMGETGNDLPPLNVNPGQSSQESALSGEETLNLVSRHLDSKLDKKFSEFKAI